VVWALDKPDPDSEVVRLGVIKSNLGVRPEPVGLQITTHGPEFVEAPQPPRTLTVLDRAVELLLDMLAEKPVPQRDILERAEAEGISKRTMDRAKRNLGIVSVKRGTDWYWSLPGRE